MLDSFLQSFDYLTIISFLAFLITLINTLFYKYFTDQRLIKRLKEDIKKLREKMNKSKGDQNKQLKIQQEMMEKNMQVMKQSFRPMIYTILPLLLIFAWMSANLVYEPIMPGEEFEVVAVLSESFTESLDMVELSTDLEITGSSQEGVFKSWFLRGEEGVHLLEVSGPGFSEEKEVLITPNKDYSAPVSSFDGSLKEIRVEHDLVRPFGTFSLFGWRPGWLGSYILLSIFFSLVLRKLFKVN